MVKIITATRPDPSCPNGVEVTVFMLKTQQRELDIEAAAKAAARDYFNTPEGDALRKKYIEKGWNFSWGDFFDNVPEETMKDHGFCLEKESFETCHVEEYKLLGEDEL